MKHRLFRIAPAAAALACALHTPVRATDFNLQTASVADIQAAYSAGALHRGETRHTSSGAHRCLRPERPEA
ncbi:MAG: hypothetical protein QM760_03155 [Nibricoccus sp.]